ncbi:pyruvate ferredoxin/flavodoxin oxidoreductase, beta subunit [Magnetococcus marinus MC-1]|uniref:Pyruvate ferredoxin/flavodoxin oxidoreductase, beta subunit n=1 Tax=Magnetococcus marinus (strain ATCC BAA-1437 / JCM 17883 / MC-1) TaxID=156889 RepID=A0L8G5_MAGMM|nr:2-oxoacid:ferredoxin oxidoreductase subunit beta [Magnetococcus marinus]6N2N_B Chain B, Pyruvate ferredoxin/flavodoxin oxidoreductase, beta subunit [Magnetococcus marinus MC-1]6N2N_D Chain D, Pyruvate ferredoxin/flavodoxin oxidoreductase, beta subunit [Magnetococcus marinus MC-1]6N2O_B Chain B, Pyruvate ferredoxin/flavodoxin oxidoreductase, beta subunit [Magnetococcus marinus MC-1]6N2O_D Chain D, Pyruvate ferredoxin/flavodoxin oxidoreductase, beta subunit [Magnetococcus marinus MC-1]ABK4425
MTVEAFHKMENMKPKDYKSEVPTTWCPGCGHFGILNGVYRAMAELGIDSTKFAAISGIGCSSRMPYFVDSYKMHTLHGRAGAVATGTQVARPDLCVVVAGGDGDGFSIGGGHMPHMARKNVNMTYVLMDNGIYGLTKGQYSPTSRPEMTAYTTPYGGPENPMNPLLYMLTYGATYVAQAFAGKPKDCAELIKGAMEHEGFAYVNIFSQCPTFNKIDTVDFYRDLVEPIPEDHDTSDLGAAMELARRPGGKAPTGLLYKTSAPTLDQNLAKIRERLGGHVGYDKNKIIALAKP